MENSKRYIVIIAVATISGFVGGVLSLFLFASPLLKFVKLETIHAETIKIDESIESKLVHAKIIKADDYLESKVVHGDVNQGVQFFLVDKKGRTSGTWYNDTDEQPSLRLFDKKSRSTAELVITPNGSAGLRIFRNGKFSVKLMVNDTGIPQLELFDEGSNPMLSLGKFYGEDVPHLTLVDKTAHRRAFMARQASDLKTAFNATIRIVPNCSEQPYQTGCEGNLETLIRFCQEHPTGHGCENLKKQ